MAVEKNAVRKDTRWMFRGRKVVVKDVTCDFVVFSDLIGAGSGLQASLLSRFIEDARDPATAEHSRLIEGLESANHDLASDSPTGKLLMLLRDAAIWQLERTYPALPRYAELAAPKPRLAEPDTAIVDKVAPVAVADECTVADECRPATDCRPDGVTWDAEPIRSKRNYRS